MNNLPPKSDSRWENLLQRAHADVGPGADVDALLRAVRLEPVPVKTTGRSAWTQDFAAVFGNARMISGCMAGAAALALVASWQVWDSWQTLPWMELLDVAAGGAS